MKINKIVKKYLSNRFSPSTEEKVQKWLIKDENTEDKEQASVEFWDALKDFSDANTYSALERVNSRIGYKKQIVRLPLYKKLSRIAAVLLPLFLVAGGYLYYQSAQSKMIEIYVAYGEEKYLMLPDSSEVWINSGTTFKYPENFQKDRRTVYLDGEAYFSVRKDEAKPFVVTAELLDVKVLGTQFNVQAYSNDEKTITTLTSGKVAVQTKTYADKILKPNEQLVFDNKTSEISITEIPSDETTSWMKGQLVFMNASLDEIFKTLERKFNKPIINNSGIPEGNLYTIKFLKGESLNEVLDVLNDMVNIKYQINSNQIVITKSE